MTTTEEEHEIQGIRDEYWEEARRYAPTVASWASQDAHYGAALHDYISAKHEVDRIMEVLYEGEESRERAREWLLHPEIMKSADTPEDKNQE